MRASLRPAAALLIVFFFTNAAPQKTVPPLAESMEVAIVNVDVMVTDRSGKPVHGLTADDFEVRDANKPQPITNFAEYSETRRFAKAGALDSQMPELAGEAHALAPVDRRTIVVFVERFQMPPAQLETFFKEIKGLLRDVVRPGDAAAVVSWSYVMKVRQDFTSDLPALDRALDAVQTEFLRRTDDYESQLLRNAFQQELLDEATMQQALPSAQALPSMMPTALFNGGAQARQALVDMRRKAGALHTLIGTLAGTPGRRIMLMAIHRFSQYAGAEYFGGEIPISMRDEFDTVDIRKDVADAANEAGVTIYPIYPEGIDQVVFASAEEGARRDAIFLPQRGIVRRDADRPMQDAQKLARSSMVLINETAAIDELAKQTGGIAAWGKSDIIRLVDTMRNDIDSYYSLAFRAPPGQLAKPHRISVVSKNRSYSVRARREYVPKNDAMRMKERVRASMYAHTGQSTLPFEITMGKISRRNRRFHIPVQVIVPIGSLTTLRTGDVEAGTFSVYAAAGGMLGIMSDVSQKLQTFTIKPEDVEKSKSSVITYDMELVSDGRADRISIGVMDETSKDWGVKAMKLAREAPRT